MMTYKEISKLNYTYWCSTVKGTRAGYLKTLLSNRNLRNIVIVKRWWGVYELYEIKG